MIPKFINSRAFTMIEIVATVLILSVAIFCVVGMSLYGIQLSHKAQIRGTAMATAIAITYDATPLETHGPLTTSTVGSAKRTTGMLNGYWVERIAEQPEPIGGSSLVSQAIHSDVYEAQGGEVAASFSTRIVGQP